MDGELGHRDQMFAPTYPRLTVTRPDLKRHVRFDHRFLGFARTVSDAGRMLGPRSDILEMFPVVLMLTQEAPHLRVRAHVNLLKNLSAVTWSTL